MNSLNVFNTRPKRLLALGATAAMLLTGSAIALAQSQAEAADQATAATVAVTDPTSGAGLGTVATDKSDGDKQVKPGGIIVDKVTYTGLKPGTIYVLHTQLFDKTAGKLVSWVGVKVFEPNAADGTETVEIPVPAGSEGHDFVVYETIWAGSDVVVGKHLEKITPRPNKTPIVKENNPNNPEQTVSVPNPQASQCTVSGYVWKDLDISGAMEDSEPKVSGVVVTLRRLTPGKDDYPGTLVTTPKTVTDANGFYKFTLPADQCGRFFVDFDETTYPDTWKGFNGGSSDLKPGNVDNGWTNPFTLTPGQNLEHVDAGLRQRVNGTIRVNTCGGFPNGEVVVELRDANNNVIRSNNPSVVWSDIAPGTYSVTFKEWNRTMSYRYFVIEGGDIVWTDNSHTYQNGYWDGGTNKFTLSSNGDKTINMCGRWESPIALDTNGNGQIDTSSVVDQPADAKFDLLGTGTAVKSGWLAQGDGFLVAPSADGSVTSIDNLFGGSLGEGYAKLSTRDANNDGVLTGAELNGLKVWVDANGDHVAQPAELHLLSEYGVTSINTKFVNAPVSNNGNVVIEHSNATTASGASIVMGDAYFAVDAEGNAVNEAALAASAAQTDAKLATLPAAEANAIRNATAGL